ncbi:MAG: DUF192 domain-containing protein [Candidatus Omnitrophota bacterium]|jgi:hypothetical protein
MSYKIVDKTNGQCIVGDAQEAKTFIQRLKGLLCRKSLSPEEALIFYNVSSIHMFFMRFPIDVFYLDKEMKVLKIKHSFKPWRMSSCSSAKITIELPAGKAKEKSVQIGDTLEFISENR